MCATAVQPQARQNDVKRLAVNGSVACKLLGWKECRRGLADRWGGFEPTVQLLTVQRFSKPPPSATRPPLRIVRPVVYHMSSRPLAGFWRLRNPEAHWFSREANFAINARNEILRWLGVVSRTHPVDQDTHRLLVPLVDGPSTRRMSATGLPASPRVPTTPPNPACIRIACSSVGRGIRNRIFRDD